MADVQIMAETPINMYQLKKELEKIRKRDNELNFRANRTEEYLQQVATFKNPEELYEKIIKLNISRLKDMHVHKIVDIAPATIAELKTLLQGYTITINNESMKKILDALNEFFEKK